MEKGKVKRNLDPEAEAVRKKCDTEEDDNGVKDVDDGARGDDQVDTIQLELGRLCNWSVSQFILTE